jgi:hypothetical protein
LGGHELEKRIIVFGLMTPHFYLICIAQSCNEKTYKVGKEHPILNIPCALAMWIWFYQLNPIALHRRRFTIKLSLGQDPHLRPEPKQRKIRVIS